MPSADPWSAARQSFLALLPAGAHLLEAGCGEGDDLCFFRQQGLVVTAFDARLALARIASRRSGQPVRVCRIEQLHSVVPYDGIWARGALPAIAPDELSDALAHLAGLLKPARPLYCAFPHPSGQPVATGSRAVVQDHSRDAATISSIVGYDGMVYFEQLAADNRITVNLPDGGQCTAHARWPDTAESVNEIPVIGPITCR